MTLTTDQIKDIADDLEALGDELDCRSMDPGLAISILEAAAGHLVSIAAMRAPVPQQAYPVPPPYPYQDLLPDAGSVSLQLTVTGRTRDELEENARKHGRGFFGTDDGLMVKLTTPACLIGDGRGYTCGAVVRQREDRDGPRHPVRGSDVPLG